MEHPRITLEQWRSLLSVVDAGGYAQAALSLHKSQSAVTYAVQKMETLLGVKIFQVIGRKAHLTPTGEVLYRRAKALIEGRLAPSIDDVAALAQPVLRHRMAQNFSARAEGATITDVIDRLSRSNL